MQIAGQSSLSLAVLKALGAQTAPAATPTAATPAAGARTATAPTATAPTAANQTAASAGRSLAAAPEGTPNRSLPRGSFVDLRICSRFLVKSAGPTSELPSLLRPTYYRF